MMRKVPILLTLAVLTVAATGCSRCRGLFHRGAPCGGTTLAAPAMLGGAIPLGQPQAVPQFAPQNIVAPQNIISQPQCVPQCVPCDPCQGSFSGGCVPCESGYHGGEDCGCQSGGGGEYFGGYTEGSTPTIMEGAVIEEGSVLPEDSSTYPGPTNQ